jgi:hypothetical protein
VLDQRQAVSDLRCDPVGKQLTFIGLVVGVAGEMLTLRHVVPIAAHAATTTTAATASAAAAAAAAAATAPTVAAAIVAVVGGAFGVDVGGGGSGLEHDVADSIAVRGHPPRPAVELAVPAVGRAVVLLLTPRIFQLDFAPLPCVAEHRNPLPTVHQPQNLRFKRGRRSHSERVLFRTVHVLLPPAVATLQRCNVRVPTNDSPVSQCCFPPAFHSIQVAFFTANKSFSPSAKQSHRQQKTTLGDNYSRTKRDRNGSGRSKARLRHGQTGEQSEPL